MRFLFFKSMNKKKITGIVLCCIGIVVARLDSFITASNKEFIISKTIGILIAFAGLAFFGSGLKKVIKKVKACPECFTKNDINETVCKKCKKGFPQKEKNNPKVEVV